MNGGIFWEDACLRGFLRRLLHRRLDRLDRGIEHLQNDGRRIELDEALRGQQFGAGCDFVL
jgi:hypothetical protein